MRKVWLAIGMAALFAGGASAQVRTIDPNQAVGQDQPPPGAGQNGGYTQPSAPIRDDDAPPPPPPQTAEPARRGLSVSRPPAQQARADAAAQAADTYQRDDLLAAGEGVFGKGAQGLAGILEKILKEQGQPNAYIAGREASGAFVVGLRYGSGMMSHKVEGQMPVYWTGPSVGFDFGGDANKVFVLVYNLYDTAELYHRFPQGEGHLYFVGGFSASYLRRGNVVLIPVRLGVGWRAGVNVGYMKFTHKSKWLPF